jgi:hypothetical protein
MVFLQFRIEIYPVAVSNNRIVDCERKAHDASDGWIPIDFNSGRIDCNLTMLLVIHHMGKGRACLSWVRKMFTTAHYYRRS